MDRASKLSNPKQNSARREISMSDQRSHPTSTPTPKRDFRQEVTDNIVALLEKGVAPWQKPWTAQPQSALPANPTTGKAYRGGNVVHLLAVGFQRNYSDPRWMTYKQASEQGWQVRKGEKGTQIEFWDVKSSKEVEEKTGRDDGARDASFTNRESNSRLIHRIYTVFNAQQIEGIPAPEPKEINPFEAILAGEKMLYNSGASISHDQANHAFYDRGNDSIHLPPKDAFKDSAGYYGTALHELAHWSGHPTRLNRSTLTDSYRFGDTNYAKEELRAELASLFMAAERGIPHNPESHAAYVGSWIAALKQDKHEIFRAAHDASKATDFILSLERDASIADTALGLGPDSSVSTGSRAVVYREEIADLDRDRNLAAEQTVDAGSGQREASPALKSGKSGRSRAGYATIQSESFDAATALTSKLLGSSAKTHAAQIESGIYRGAIIAETSDLFLQRLSPKSVVAHPKDIFAEIPQIGAEVSVKYANAKPLVRELKQRERAMEMSR